MRIRPDDHARQSWILIDNGPTRNRSEVNSGRIRSPLSKRQTRQVIATNLRDGYVTGSKVPRRSAVKIRNGVPSAGVLSPRLEDRTFHHFHRSALGSTTTRSAVRYLIMPNPGMDGSSETRMLIPVSQTGGSPHYSRRLGSVSCPFKCRVCR